MFDNDAVYLHVVYFRLTTKTTLFKKKKTKTTSFLKYILIFWTDKYIKLYPTSYHLVCLDPL